MGNEEYGLETKDLEIMFDAIKGKVRRKEREETRMSKSTSGGDGDTVRWREETD